MPAMRFVALSLALVAANARIVFPPLPTQTLASQNEGWTPRPTEAPISPWHVGNAFDLLRRQTTGTTATCGYINGIQSVPFICYPGYSCTSLYQGGNPLFGCCKIGATSSCTLPTSCLNYGATGLLENLNAYSVSCTASEAPDCMFLASRGTGTDLYANYGCTNTPDLGVFLDTTYGPGLNDVVTLSESVGQFASSISVTFSTPASTTASGSSTTNSASASITQPIGGGGSGTSTPTPTPGPQHSGLSTGAKAGIGGGIGGAVALAIIGGLIWALTRKKKGPQAGQTPSGKAEQAGDDQLPQHPLAGNQQAQATPPPGYAGAAGAAGVPGVAGAAGAAGYQKQEQNYGAGYQQPQEQNYGGGYPPQQQQQPYGEGYAQPQQQNYGNAPPQQQTYGAPYGQPQQTDPRYSTYSQPAPLSPMSTGSPGVPSPTNQAVELHAQPVQPAELHANPAQPHAAELWSGERSGPIPDHP